MNYIFLLLSIFGIISKTNSQNTITYKKYDLSRFGIVYIPAGIDTLSQELAKNQIFKRNIDRLKNIDQKNMKTKYRVNITRSLFENTNKDSYFFWLTKTMQNILDLNLFKDQNSTSNFDQSTIEYIPSITLKKVPVKINSKVFKKEYFEDNEKANKYVKNIEKMMNELSPSLYNESDIKTTSEYYLLQDQFPVVKVSNYITLPNDNGTRNIVQTIYNIFQNYGIYTIKFEYYLEEKSKWEHIIKYFMTHSKFL